MKNIILLLTFLSFSVLAGSTSGDFGIYSSLQYESLTGNLAQGAGGGFAGLNTGLSYELSETINIGADIGYLAHVGGKQGFLDSPINALIPVLGTVRYYIPITSKLYPYLGAGAGGTYVMSSLSDDLGGFNFSYKPVVGLNYKNINIELSYSNMGSLESKNSSSSFSLPGSNTTSSLEGESIKTVGLMFTWGFSRSASREAQIDDAKEELKKMDMQEFSDLKKKDNNYL